jgi:hypothetical protein
MPCFDVLRSIDRSLPYTPHTWVDAEEPRCAIWFLPLTHSVKLALCARISAIANGELCVRAAAPDRELPAPKTLQFTESTPRQCT